MKRVLITILISFFGLLIAGLMFIVYTEKGLQVTYNLVQDSVPGELSTGRVSGRLIGPLKLTGIQYSSDELKVVIDSFSIDWKPSRLLFLEVQLADVDVSGIDIETGGSKGTTEEPEGLPEINLPVSIKVEDLLIRDLAILQSGSAAAFIINEINLKAAINKKGLSVTRLSILTPAFDISLNGKVKPQGNYPLSINTEWNVRPDGLASISGKGAISGTLDRLNIEQEVNAPFNARLHASAYDAMSALRWDMNLEVKELYLNRVNETWPEASVAARSEGSGSVSSFNINGDIDLVEKQYGNFSGSFSLEKENDNWLARNITISVPETDAVIKLSGRFSQVGGNTSFHSQGNWNSLSWPLTGDAPLAFSRKGTFEIKGSPDEYTFILASDVSGQHIPQSNINFSGKGDRKGMDDLSLSIKLLDGELKTEGSFAWQPVTSWEASIKGQSLNPGAQWPDWPGKLNMTASARGDVKDGKQRVIIEGGHINGDLRDLPVTADVIFEMHDNVFTLPKGEFVFGSSHVSASGSYSSVWDAQWSVSIPELGEIFQGGKGEIKGEGKLSGASDLPTVKTHVTGNGISLDAYKIVNLVIDMNIDGTDKEQSNIDVSAENVIAGSREIEKIVLKAGGRLVSHTVDLRTKSDRESIRLSVDAGFSNDIWKGRFTGSELDFAEYGKWVLREPEVFSFSSKAIRTGNLCWKNSEASACFQTAWTGQDGLAAKAALLNIPLSLLNSHMPPDFSLEGLLSGKADVTHAGDTLYGQLDFDIPSGSINYKPDIEDPVTVHLEQIQLDGLLDEKGLDLQIDLSLREKGVVKAAINLPGFLPLEINREQQSVSGHLTTELRILELIPLFVPGIKNTTGTARADMNISGTLVNPAIFGSLRLDNGHVEIPDFGSNLDDINIEIKADRSGRLDVQGEMQSGGGTLSMGGNVALGNSAEIEADIVVKGQNVEAVKTPEVRVVLSPDIRLRIQNRNISIDGELSIPEASIEPPDLSNAVLSSKDVTVVSKDSGEQAEEKWKIKSDIKLLLGDNVRFNSFGLTGRIQGGIHIQEEPGKAVKAQGELQVLEGRYKAYGQELTVEKGRLMFVGIVDDPGLDIRAIRKIKEINAGVQVSGTLRTPEMMVFSDPYMDQSDALSYLLFGRPMNGLSGSEGGELHSAASSAGLSGGGIIAKKIGAKFGLEDIEIEEGESDNESALVIGRYLSTELYVSYGIGLFEPINTLRMRYILSPKWLLQTEYGLESSGDLLYKIEK